MVVLGDFLENPSGIWSHGQLSMAWRNSTSFWTTGFPSGFQFIRLLGLRLVPRLKFRARRFAALVLVLSAGTLWFKIEIQHRMLESLARIDPLPHTRELIAQYRYAEAYEYLSFFRVYDYVASNRETDSLYKDIQTRRNSYSYRLHKIGQGILVGQSDETEGQISALISDFLIIGDIRDLTREGINYAEGKKVDELTAALAAIGIAVTTGNLFSSGGVTPAKIVLSFLKMINSINKMPDWLQRYLIEEANVVKAKRARVSIGDFFDVIYRLLKATGVRSTASLLNRAHDMDSFMALADFGIYFGNETSVLLEITGDTGVSVFQKNKAIPKKIFLEAAIFGAPGVDALGTIGTHSFERFLEHDAAAAATVSPAQAHPLPVLNAISTMLWHILAAIPAWLLSLSMVYCGALVARR
jgi:hypothetical protein